MVLARYTLPTIAPIQAGETLHGYGCRVLAFVLETSVTATLSDRDLELAEHAYPIAVGAHDIAPIAVDRLSAVQHAVLAARATRRTYDAEQATNATACVPPTGGTRPGKPATLQPIPKPLSPASVAIDIRF